jgi:hypothetical protein
VNHKEIIEQLKQPFPVAAHKERKLPGGGRWFYIPWQAIRDRLDEVCPEWEVSYSAPGQLGEYCYITCTITIGGVSRSAPGNAPMELLSSSGKDMSRGTPIERAIADAFKNASESFGVARYLDDQDFVVRYMQSRGDGRAYKFATEAGQLKAGARGIPKQPTPIKKEGDSKPQLSLAPDIDRDLVNSEIESVLKRKGISISEAKELLSTKYQARSRSELNDEQLVQLLEILRMKPSNKEAVI